MTIWSSLYFPSADTEIIAARTRDSLTALDYTLYNPFGLMPGKAYPHTVRLFVAPAEAGWVRVVGVPDVRQLPALSRGTVCLWLALDGSEADIALFADGDHADPAALTPHLNPGTTLDDLRAALDSPHLHTIEPDTDADVPLALLPDDVQTLAADIDQQQAQRLFNRLTRSLLNRSGGSDDVAKAAHDLIHAQHPPNWNSPGGQRIRAVMTLLTVPDGWRDPDFTTLRDAYQVHERKRRKPGADLYPGDAEAMAHVMNALDYVPVYAGRAE